MMPFEAQVLSFVDVQFICSFVAVSFVWNQTIHCQILRSWIFISIFSSNNFIVLALTFSLLLHFDLMVWSRRSNRSWLIIYPRTIWADIIFFSPLNDLSTHVKKSSILRIRVYSWLQILFHCSMLWSKYLSLPISYIEILISKGDSFVDGTFAKYSCLWKQSHHEWDSKTTSRETLCPFC